MSAPTLQLPTPFVRQAVAHHDARLSKRMMHFRAFRACYRGRFWEERSSSGYNRYLDKSEDGQIRVEVNRAYGWIESYVGSLFNDKTKAHFKPDPTGIGDPVKAELATNQFMRAKRTSRRLTRILRQALMYDGAGIKVGRDDSDPAVPARSQVWARVVPWWEMVLDYDCIDEDEQRFIGHLYWIPLADARKRFNRPDLTGTLRPDALASTRDRSLAGRKAKGKAGLPGDVVNDEFVRVLEWYNLVDDFCAGEADPISGVPHVEGSWEPTIDPATCKPIRSKGRYEVWLPDQRQDDRPFGPTQVFPMPDVSADGKKPIAPVIPIVLVSDPEYPLHGLSSLERIYDQIRELNISRTFKSNAVKRNSRQVIVEEGSMTADSEVAFEQGADGAMLKFKQNAEKSRSPQTVIGQVMLPAIPAENFRYDEEIERDMAQGTNQAPFTRGDPVAGISATQTNVLNQHSQTEIGQLALTRDLWFEQFVALYLRVLIRTLRATGETLSLDYRRKKLAVTPEDLDADFEIEILPGPTTPLAMQMSKQEFLALQPLLWALIEKVRKGDPVAAVMLDDVVDKYELDERYRSDNVLRLEEERAPESDAGGAPPTQPGAGSALPGGGSLPSPEAQPQPGPPPGGGQSQPGSVSGGTV